MFGVDSSYAWSFKINDRRAFERDSVARVRGDPNDLIYLDIKNHGWASLKSCRQGLGYKVPYGGPVTAEPEDTPLLLETKVYKGWRVSWCKTGRQTREERRRATLATHYAHRPTECATLPEAMPQRSLDEKKAADGKTRTLRAVRVQQTRAMRLRKGEVLRALPKVKE